MQDGQTQAQRLAAYLEHAREHVTDDLVRELEDSARGVDQRLATLNAEERATYGDMMDMLSSAVTAKFGQDDEDYWAYVCDFTDDWVVFSEKGQKLQATYEVNGDGDGDVDLGEAVPVREVTTYVPMENAPARSANWPTAKRAFSSLMERPPAQATTLAVRMASDGEDSNIAHFDGYAYTINERYGVTDWLGTYQERIGPGAASKTLREQTVPLLINHGGVPIASTASSTSELADDGKGLRNRALLDRRQGLTNDICIALERGDVSKMSFSFRAVQEDWNDSYDDRFVRELQLYDTSIVTYPANPNTSAELVDGFRSALGREGRSLWLAETELSVRSALPVIVQAREVDGDAGDLLERALRALVHADEILCRSHGPHGRARTFHVAGAILELRAGKTLSAKNQKLLQGALDALAAADRQHAKVGESHSAASDAVRGVLDSATPVGADADGKGANTGAGTSGDPVSPQDGAGPRSAALKLKREREAELRALRRH